MTVSCKLSINKANTSNIGSNIEFLCYTIVKTDRLMLLIITARCVDLLPDLNSTESHLSYDDVDQKYPISNINQATLQ